MTLPLIAKLALLGAAALIAFRKKGPSETAGSGLPATEKVKGSPTPVVGERWVLAGSGVTLVSIVSESGPYEGFYDDASGKLVAVVDSSTFDPGRTSAIVVKRDAAPDLPDVWA